jgi:hypothetical protein
MNSQNVLSKDLCVLSEYGIYVTSLYIKSLKLKNLAVW